MFLKLAHTQLDVYKTSKALILEVYRITKQLPASEKFGLIGQLRRAALSIHLITAEGCSRRTQNERIRYFEISRGSLIEVDTAIGVSFDLKYVSREMLELLGEQIIDTFKMLRGMIDRT